MKKRLLVVLGIILIICIVVIIVVSSILKTKKEIETNDIKETEIVENNKNETNQSDIIEDIENNTIEIETTQDKENKTEEKAEEVISSTNQTEIKANEESSTNSNITSNKNSNAEKQTIKEETISKEETQTIQEKPNVPVSTPTEETTKPQETEPIRIYKKNTAYIEKLRQTVTTEVTNNLSQLNKYGITQVSQFIIIEDSSICACYGGHRNGWTYENTTAYNTFKSSILKGTSIKIYAVDEYQNGQYIQTLCYYGH